ncbi:hypothetical protein [Paralysiella testudinis]|uniref:hypothetical protein n=1 Tax=Paralysiella testudinis TaxID=2809020 RepID=UPI001E28C74E|nr:hypothetical protein [Paralysiella testudinis]
MFLILFVPLLLGYGAKVYLGLKDRYVPGEEQQQAVEGGSQMNGQVYSGQNQPHNGQSGQYVGQSLTAAMYAPTIPEKPESKPLYDAVRQVTTFERVAACIEGGKSGCTCYTDQATVIKEISPADCRKYVENGLPFNPFKQPEQQPLQQQPQQLQELTGSGAVMNLSGQPKANLAAVDTTVNMAH